LGSDRNTLKRHYYDEVDFDVLIIDSAPTGTALRLLSLPEVGGWLVYEKILQTVTRNVGGFTSSI
jgi:anion-transporting  ArsA/GET3 family ATPase